MTNIYKPVPHVETTYDQLFSDGHYEEAITVMQHFLDDHLHNPYAKMLAQINIASCYYCLGKIEIAYEHVLIYKQLCTQHGNKQDHYNLCHISALIYEYEQHYDKAVAAIQECIQIASTLNLQLELAESYNLFSHIQNVLGHYEEATKYATLAQEIIYSINSENLYLICQIHCNLASSYIHSGRYAEAQNILQILSTNPFIQSNSKERSKYLYFQGFLQMKAQHFDLAISLLNESQDIAKSCNDLHLLKRLMWDLAHAYEEMKNFQSAFSCMKMHSVISTDLLMRRNTSNVTEIHLHHDIALVEQRANIDQLSGVYNRSYLESTCDEWLKEAKPNKTNVCCIVFDVDNFKQINDTYGHLAGDEVIKKIGAACSELISGENSFVARFGGDEFVIILRNATQEAVFNKSREIFETLSRISVKAENQEIRITISMGIVCNQSIIANRFTQLFKVADQALYMAKNQGKNQIVSLTNNCSI